MNPGQLTNVLINLNFIIHIRFSYVVSMLSGDQESDAFEVDFDGVRQIPERADPVDMETLEQGTPYDCWYAQEEKFYPATIEGLTENGTVMVTFDGFDEQDEIPIQYLQKRVL